MTGADLITTFKKQPVGFSCAVLCVIMAVLLYFRSDKIDESQTEFEARSAERTKILANVRNSENLAKQVTEMQALSKEMESRLVHAGQLAVNLQYFYKLEAENEVKLLEVRQGNAPKSKSLYIGIPYNVAVQGSFKQVLAFLQRLESGRHFCHFSSVTFTKSGGATVDAAGAAAADMTLNLTLELLGQP